MVQNNPNAENLYNPVGVSPTIAVACAIIGFLVAIV